MNKEKKDQNEKVNNLRANIFTLAVANNQDRLPYLNVFNFEGDNFDQKKLGKLFGVIKVSEESENSAYVANIITQIIKKEFYRHYKINTEKSFGEALHKVNLSLADLSRCDIIEWIGKIDALIGVIKNDKLIFSQVGKAAIILLRNRKIVFIQRIEEPDILEKNLTAHPIKTFSELSSGQIKDGDKIVISNGGLFQIFSDEDLKRHAQALNSNEFDNLIASTVKAEGDEIGLIVINISFKNDYSETLIDAKEKQEEVNFFGNVSIKDKMKNKKNAKQLRKDADKKQMENNNSTGDKSNNGNKVQETVEENGPMEEVFAEKEKSKINSFSKIIYMKETDDTESIKGENMEENFWQKIFSKIKNIHQMRNSLKEKNPLETIKNKAVASSGMFKNIITKYKKQNFSFPHKIIDYKRLKNINSNRVIKKIYQMPKRAVKNIRDRIRNRKD